MANGVAILNNERLLEPSALGACTPAMQHTHSSPSDNWGVSQLGNKDYMAAPSALKYQVINFYNGFTYMRGTPSLCQHTNHHTPPPAVPLAIINAIVAVGMLVF